MFVDDNACIITRSHRRQYEQYSTATSSRRLDWTDASCNYWCIDNDDTTTSTRLITTTRRTAVSVSSCVVIDMCELRMRAVLHPTWTDQLHVWYIDIVCHAINFIVYLSVWQRSHRLHPLTHTRTFGPFRSIDTTTHMALRDYLFIFALEIFSLTSSHAFTPAFRKLACRYFPPGARLHS